MICLICANGIPKVEIQLLDDTENLIQDRCLQLCIECADRILLREYVIRTLPRVNIFYNGDIIYD